MDQSRLYLYRGRVISVYDGDTCTVDIDLGFKTHIKGEKVRLARIDAPEIRGIDRSAGLASRDYLRSLILGNEIILETEKDKRGKYGRYLGELWLMRESEWININDLMVSEGFAEYREY